MTEGDKKNLDNLVKDHASKLAEHFDSVRIFVTRHNGGDEESAGYTFGIGNYYAQRGQIGEWVTQQEEIERQRMRGDQ
jgi:hypothetical protein